MPARTFDPAARQQRQLKQLVEHTQKLYRQSEQVRAEFFWSKIKPASTQEWANAVAPFKKAFWEDVIGRFPPPNLPVNPRTRKLHDRPKWVGYEVVLDVFPDVFAWGYLLVPKDLKPGERRPVVVCQHGLEGLPESVINEDPTSRKFSSLQSLRSSSGRAGLRRVRPA